MKLRFFRLKHLDQVDGQLVRAFPSSAGADLRSNSDFMIPGRSSILVSTGIGIELPTEPDQYGFTYHVQIWPRSGLSAKFSVETGAGLGDAEYRGEYKVHLYNHGNKPFKITKGDRIAQVVIVPCVASPFEEVEELTDTTRGEGGFGSSGVQ